MSRIELVCFDLGRVLIRIADNWQHACRLAGVAVPPAEPDAAGKATMNDLVARHETGQLSDAGFFEAAGRVFGLTAEQTGLMVAAYLIEPYPGVADLLAELKSRGLKTACLSNTNTGHWRAMCDRTGRCGLPLHELDWRFASQEIGLRKPDRAIFEHVEKVVGLPGESIVFFDDAEANVTAAKACGWQAHQIAVDGNPMAQVRKHLAALGVVDSSTM